MTATLAIKRGHDRWDKGCDMTMQLIEWALYPMTGAVLAGITLDDRTLMPAGAVCGLIIMLVTLTFKFTRWQTQVNNDLAHLKDTVTGMAHSLNQIKDVMVTRPCVGDKDKKKGGNDCPITGD